MKTYIRFYDSIFFKDALFYTQRCTFFLLQEKYMLFAGWEVRIVKNCDRGLENAARGRRPRAAFSRPSSQFFTIRTDPKPVNNFFFFAYKKTVSIFVNTRTKSHESVTVARGQIYENLARPNNQSEGRIRYRAL